MKRLVGSLLAVLILLTGAVSALVENPLADPAFDLTDTLSEPVLETIRDINRQLQPAGVDLAVAMIPTTGDQSIEDYANQLFRKWGLGDRDKNNGVLLLIAKEDRKMRIEVGYGLEGAIPDAVAGRIIRELMTPAFQKSDYDTGVLAAFNALATLAAEEYDLELQSEAYRPVHVSEEGNSETPLVVYLFFLALLLLFVRRRYRRHGLGGFFWDGGGHWGGGGGGGGSSSSGGSFGGGSSGGGGASGGW